MKTLPLNDSKPTLEERFQSIKIEDGLKSPFDQYNYEIAFGPSWGTTQFHRTTGFQDPDVAKKPKSRKLFTSASTKKEMHNKRVNLKSQSMKRGDNLAQPPLDTVTDKTILLQLKLCGANLLYERISRSTEYNIKDDQIREFITFVYGKLKSVKISFIQEKLCMCIAKYIVYTCNLTGEDYILRVIEEGSLSVEALPNALTILSYIPEELRIISGNKDLATFAKTRLITDCHKVYDYICGILNSENIKDDTVKATFKTLEEWIIKSDKFYSHEEIQSIIFNALNSKWFVEVKSILSTVIIKSQNAKLFLNANLDAILDDIDLIIQQRNQQLPADFVPKFKTIQPNEQRFLDSLVNFIIDSKENFKAEIDDIESEFCSNISDLTIDLFQNFEVLIYEDSERAVKIFEVILMILSHKSRSISLQAIEFFGDFKESISIIKAKYTDLEFFIEPYFEAVKIVLEKSKRKLFQQNESGEYFEPEDSDNDKQEDISIYREYAADLFFNLYHICEMLKRNDKKAIFEDMLCEMFYINENNSLDHVCSIEVAIFAAKSTYEALELPRDKLIDKVWKCILKMGDICEPTILHSSLLFFNDCAEYLIYDKSVITQTLNYIKLGFNTFKYISCIQTIIFKCLVEICQNMSNWKTSENDFDNSAPK